MNETNTQLLNVLTREGVLIKVSVRFWRGCKKLSPEDIGLDASDLSDRLISLGHKRLLPKEATSALALAESRAHALIESSTFPFLDGLAHFLPNRRIDEVMSRLRSLEQDFWRARDEFVDQYSQLRSQAVREWREMASKLVNDPERLVATIEAAFPLRLDRHFGFETRMFQIAVPETLTTELFSVVDHQRALASRQRAVQEAGDKIRRDTERFVSDCIATLREQTAQICEEMLHSMESGTTTGVHQKTLNRLIGLIEEFKQMNFANDSVMEEQLEKVRQELLSRTAEEYRDNRFAQRKLKEGLRQGSARDGGLAAGLHHRKRGRPHGTPLHQCFSPPFSTEQGFAPNGGILRSPALFGSPLV